VLFFAPEVAFTEARDNLSEIALQRRLDLPVLLAALARLRGVVETVPTDITDPLKDAALNRIGVRDPMDWPFVAAALALDCPVWTEDRDFFGAGVATWTTNLVEIYLRGD